MIEHHSRLPEDVFYISYVCAHCGRVAQTPVRVFDNGTAITCSTCGQDTVFNLSRSQERTPALPETIPPPSIQPSPTALAQLDAEVKILREALDTIPLDEYGEAIREGCSASGAWDCFREALRDHIAIVRSCSAVYKAAVLYDRQVQTLEEAARSCPPANTERH